MRNRSEAGFTLIELMVVVLIIAILLAVGIPSFLGYRTRAFDADAQADLRTTVLTESVLHLDTGVFTTDTPTLSAAEPTVDFNVTGDPEGTVRVAIGTAETEVCMFSLSRSGNWWAIYHTSDSGTFYGQSAPAACQASLAGGWATAGW